MNVSIVTGNLGREVKIQKIKDDLSKVMFSVACNESYYDKSKNAYEQKTDWVSVELFCREQYLGKFKEWKKGDEISVEGKNASATWEREGEKFFKQFLKARTARRIRKGNASKEDVITNDEIPF